LSTTFKPSWGRGFINCAQRGVVEEAPGACKDVAEVVNAAEAAGLARKVARTVALICIKG
jgi:tRNA-splicing ligase RtcB